MPFLADDMVDMLLDEAEAHGSCFAAHREPELSLFARRAEAGELVRPAPRLYARREHWTTLCPEERELHVIRGIARLGEDWIFCGPSAALLHGLSVSRSRLGTVEVCYPRGGRRLYGGRVLTRHMGRNAEAPVYLDGARATPLLRTALDCMRTFGLRDGLAVADSALRAGGLSREELVSYIDAADHRLRGIGRAREVALLADGRAANGGESVARGAMWELGFAAPDLQLRLIDPVDGGVYFADFAWTLADGSIIAGELDGGEKYTNPAMNGGDVQTAMRRERLRESRLTASCRGVARLSMEDVADTWRLNRVLEAFGVPRDHEPLIDVPAGPVIDEVPLEAYGIS